MFLKLANMVETDIQRFAGGPQDLWEEKEARKSVKIMYAAYGWCHLHLPATRAEVSTRSQAYSQAASHGASSMFSVLCF